MEKTGYIFLGISAAVWFIIWFGAVFVGLISLSPLGLLWLLPVAGFGLLFLKALMDRLDSEEDDYYSKQVDK